MYHDGWKLHENDERCANFVELFVLWNKRGDGLKVMSLDATLSGYNLQRISLFHVHYFEGPGVGIKISRGQGHVNCSEIGQRHPIKGSKVGGDGVLGRAKEGGSGESQSMGMDDKQAELRRDPRVCTMRPWERLAWLGVFLWLDGFWFVDGWMDSSPRQ